MICHVSIYMAEQQRSILLEDDWMVINSGRDPLNCDTAGQMESSWAGLELAH